MRRAMADARGALRDDPYNFKLLDLLQKDVMAFDAPEGAPYSARVVERTPGEDKAEYARRKLLVSPYDAELWMEYGRHAYQGGMSPETFLMDEPARINAIVYSGHDPVQLAGYMFDKWHMLANLERLDTDPQRPEWQAASPERQAEAEANRQAWLAVRSGIDMDAALRCPMMRAYRLIRPSCRDAASGCDIPLPMQEMYEIVRSDVNARGVCKGVMAPSVEGLLFAPVPVDLAGPGGWRRS
jgi:hypothetical protein